MATEGKKYRRKQFLFTGEWNPSDDPLKIGEQNFSDLQNLQYCNFGLEGVPGYTKINTNALSIYRKGRSGIQIRTPHTVKSYALIQALNVAESASGVLENRTPIPDKGDFESNPLHVDASGAGLGRFAKWPRGHIAYCNEKESKVWAGLEKECNAFITSTAAIEDSIIDAIDYTESVKNTLQTPGNIAIIGASRMNWVIGASRPLKGIKYYLSTVNQASSPTITGKQWNGNSWSLFALTDGTNGLKQNGSTGFDSTVDTSRVKFLENQLLYFYQFELSAGEAEIYHVTLDAAFQSVLDIWDSLFRTPIQFRCFKASAWLDGTMNVIEETPAGLTGTDAYIINIGGLTDAEYIDVGFQERMCGMRVTMYERETGKVNTTTASMILHHWNGGAYEGVTGFVDGTETSSKTFAQTGVVTWNPPDEAQEFQKEEFGVKLWYYRIKVSAALSESVWIDMVQGIPAPRTIKPAYKFPFMFQNRPMLCAFDKQGNRVDYGMTDTTDVFNGEDSSFGPGRRPLYFGGSEELTCACELYNRFGSSLYYTGIFCKATETYLLSGYDHETWNINPISKILGCPAPLTMDTAEIGYDMAQDVVRHVAIWVTYTGPVMFDAGVFISIKGNIRCYFDPEDSRCINRDAIDKSRGWFDPQNIVYNLQIPSGAAQPTPNVWLVYDLMRKRWYAKVPGGTNPYPGAAFRVVDEYGTEYIYGCRDNGYMMRLEHGNTWDGQGIQQIVAGADTIPSGDMWDFTEIVKLKLAAIAIGQSVSVTIRHYKDGEADATTLISLSLKGSNRHVRGTQSLNLKAWSHLFKFSATTGATAKGMRLLGYAYLYDVIREDKGMNIVIREALDLETGESFSLETGGDIILEE